MENKVGPYGSHYGTGCYTRNCSLRNASDAGVKQPLTFVEAQKQLVEVFSDSLGAGSRTEVEQTEITVQEAKLAVNSTPEGLRLLKKQYRDAKKLHGNAHPLVIKLENDVDVASINYNRVQFEYRKGIFDNASVVTPKDLRTFTEYSDKYEFCSDASVKNYVTKQKLVKINKDGSFDYNGHHVSPQDSQYNNVKKEVSAEISKDALSSFDKQTKMILTSKVNTEIGKSFDFTNMKQDAQGKTRTLVDKNTQQAVAFVHYDNSNVFQYAEFASKHNDGSLAFPMKDGLNFLKLVRSGGLNKPLPEYLQR